MAIGLGRSALARDVASLPTFVADLAGRIQRSSVRRGAVTRNMALDSSALVYFTVQ